MTNEIPQCIHIPDGSVVVSGELFDMACAAIAERDKLLSEIEQLKVERDFARRELTRACQETREALSRDITAARGSPEPCEHPALKAGDELAHQSIYTPFHERWWQARGGHDKCTVCATEGASRDAPGVVQRVCHALTDNCVMFTDPERPPCTPENCKAVKASRDASSEVQK